MATTIEPVLHRSMGGPKRTVRITLKRQDPEFLARLYINEPQANLLQRLKHLGQTAVKLIRRYALRHRGSHMLNCNTGAMENSKQVIQRRASTSKLSLHRKSKFAAGIEHGSNAFGIRAMVLHKRNEISDALS
ncbi:hypothetical protein HG530_001426 [Fusarium avenaceum]|nr:hypothetical protein HG530_001426 [Fusarium avenaceum]